MEPDAWRNGVLLGTRSGRKQRDDRRGGETEKRRLWRATSTGGGGTTNSTMRKRWRCSGCVVGVSYAEDSGNGMVCLPRITVRVPDVLWEIVVYGRSGSGCGRVVVLDVVETVVDA